MSTVPFLCPVMVAVVEADPTQENLGLDPLPDVDFNIRCGNTLVGYASHDHLVKSLKEGGMGFDYRLQMNIPDYWIKIIKERKDEDWHPSGIFWELTNRRRGEATISYAESHDQALVGDKTIIFRLVDADMYWHFEHGPSTYMVDRGIALHKMIRLMTASTINGGYLTFMGNEFGHPEWIDFPREGNGWSYRYARRQWSLADNGLLRYGCLEKFDSDMVHYLRSEKLLSDAPELLVADEEKKILIFRRKNTIFALNFNPVASFDGYGFSSPEGTFKVAFTSDAGEYDGFDRIQAGEEHMALPGKSPNGNQSYNHTMYLYLPCRCAVVLKKI